MDALILNYKIVNDYNQANFEAKIGQLLKNGWQPHGRMVVHSETGELMQAMVLCEAPVTKE